ncbi:HD domain-containing phosphohydrolase [Orenia marismortui]|uniref:HD-GYP domain-containing protein (C-di-GMP phosphodiesterase class II) n=1 Tax=Orenia marismortui TaxID=46469 RepID=A0A4R8GRD0_9FIRM|nr:HD domain-containing phosphohydrolase [Orenia marismortui]TDX48419.1 HD-GYP domain-containing protein (c-di-GMP phosphodiesterase class II) [Orenia marismortui]
MKLNKKNRGIKLNDSLILKVNIIIIIALILFISVLALLINNLVATKVNKLAQERNLEIARSFKERAASFLDQTEIIVQTLSNESGIKNIDKKYMLKKFEEIDSEYDYFLNIYFGTKAGEFISYSKVDDEGFDPRLRSWYKRAIKNEGIIWTKVYEDAFTGEKVITVAKRVYSPAEKFIGVLAVDVTLETLSNKLVSKKVGEKGFAYMIAKNGELIAHPDQDLINKKFDINQLFNIEKVLANKEGNLKYKYQGEMNLASYVSIDRIDGVILTQNPLSEVYDISNQLNRKIILLTLVVIIMLTLIVYLINRQYLLIPIKKAVEFADGVSNDPFNARKIEIKRKDEIGVLLAALNGMSEEIEANYQQLEAYNEEITAQNEELEEAYINANKLANDLKDLIELLSNLSQSTIRNEEEFLSYLLNKAIKIIPEADYGSVYLYQNKKVKFLDAIGHDLDSLKDLNLSEEEFKKRNKGVNVIRDIISLYSSDDYEKEKLQEASKPIKETISFDLYDNNEALAGISLDIGIDSNKNFDKKAEDLMNAFKSIISSYYAMQKYNDLQDEFKRGIIFSIVKMLEIHDEYTTGHSENVAKISKKIAQRMDLSDIAINQAYWAGLVHDIGKILIPKEILNKEEKLTDEEYKLIKEHPVWAYDTLKSCEKLRNIAEIVLYHHEAWDGGGYPEEIKKDQIPLISQIITVADTWDAMRSNRSYRKALDKEIAIQEIKENRGKQFAPKVVDIFLKLLEENKIDN